MEKGGDNPRLTLRPTDVQQREKDSSNIDIIAYRLNGSQDLVDEIASFLCIDDRRSIGCRPRRMDAIEPLVLPSLLHTVRVVDVMQSSTAIVFEIELPSSRRYQIGVHRPLPYYWIRRESCPPFNLSVMVYSEKVHEEYAKTEWHYSPHRWSFNRLR